MILRAEGRGFNAGVDIKEMQRTEGFSALIDANRGCFAAFRAVYECAVPVIAAVNGFCVGGGIGLVGNADVIVASDDATFGLPEVERGALGAATHLSRLVPQHMMRRLFFTAATVDAATLHHFGSVHEVVPRDELDEAALRVARDIAAKDTRVIRAAKEALNLIDVQRVNSSYRMEQGFTFELNLAGVSDEHRDAFAGTTKGTSVSDKTNHPRRGRRGVAQRHDHRHRRLGITAQADGLRARLLRTDITDLTVVTYGGPDLGLLCSAGKVKRVYYGFVSLDSPPFYDPWFAKARTSGAIEAREMDEGMLRCGLQAAAQRLPFLPIRAGLGSSVPDFWEGELATVTSPYAAPGGGHETLIAMPALRLDAAFVHLNLGDSQGNAAYTGIDPYFDDLFLMAAEKRFLSVERIVPTQELIKAVPPQALLVNRMMVDCGGGSARRRPLHHRRTGLRPRREISAALRRGGLDRRGLAGLRADLPVGQRRRLPGGRESLPGRGIQMSSRAEVCAVACAELFRDAGEIMVSPMTNMASVGARLARLTFSPDILLTDGEAQLIADTPALGAPAAVEGWMPFGRVFETLAWGRRHVVMGANQVDRFGNQNISAFGPLQQPDAADVRPARRARQRDQPRDQLLGRQPLQAGVLRCRRRGLRDRLGQGGCRQPRVPVRQHLPGGVQPRRVRLRRARSERCGR